MNVEGLQPTTEKVDAVVNAPVPRNVSELKSYLDLINILCQVSAATFYNACSVALPAT